ncbi:MAG: FkbM family methyltransferase [bacterium]
MNYLMAKEVGILRYVWRRLAWRGMKLLPGAECALTLPNGVVLMSPRTSYCGSDVFVTGAAVDWGTEWILAAYLHRRPKGVFVDVGANIGYYSALLSPYFNKGYAFDPDPRNQVALAGLSVMYPHVKVVSKAVCDHNGVEEFVLGDVSDVSSLGRGELAGAKVSCVTLSSFFQDHLDAVVAVKIDIEGYDVTALRGAGEMILRCRPLVVTEFGLESGKPNSPGALVDLAHTLRMDLYGIVRRDPSFWSCDFKLGPISPVDLVSEKIKMLIMVPQEDDVFRTVLQMLPSRWSRRILGGRAISRITAACLREVGAAKVAK